MASRLSCCGGSSSSNQSWIDFPVGASTSENLSLALKSEFNKVEFEYAMVVDSVDKMEVGRITILWDKTEAVITSHEQEDSPNLGTLDNVVITPWHSATDFGVTITNNYGDILDFKYLYMNKVLLPFTLNPVGPTLPLTFSNTHKSNNVGISGSNLIATKIDSIDDTLNHSQYTDSGVEVTGTSKFYYEAEINAIGFGYGFMIGFIPRDANPPTTFENGSGLTAMIGGLSNKFAGVICAGGDIRYDVGSGIASTAPTSSYGNGDKVGIAYDYALDTITFYKNGVANGSISGAQSLASIGEFLYFGSSLTVDTDQITKIQSPAVVPSGYTVV